MKQSVFKLDQYLKNNTNISAFEATMKREEYKLRKELEQQMSMPPATSEGSDLEHKKLLH